VISTWCRPKRGREQRRHREDQHQHDPHHRLDEREGPPAQLVGHLEPQQRVAGHPGHAGERPDHEGDEDGDDEVRDQPEQREGQPRTEDGQAEQPAAAEVGQQPRAEEHPAGQTEEHGAEQQAVARVAAAEVGDERAGQADHRAAGGERAEHAHHEAADEAVATDVRPALDQGSPHAGMRLALGQRVTGRDRGQPQDRERADQERRRVDVQSKVDGGDLGQCVVEDAREQRQAGEDDRGDRRRAVRREEAELVGRLEPLPRDQVRDRGLLGRDPDQARDLDEERRDEQPGEGADQGDGEEQREPGHVADHHRQATVQPVGHHASDRADQDGGGEPEDEHAGDRDVGGRVAVVGQPGSERGQREQAEPVAEAGQ
jgi:hypothetical protein